MPHHKPRLRTNNAPKYITAIALAPILGLLAIAYLILTEKKRHKKGEYTHEERK